MGNLWSWASWFDDLSTSLPAAAASLVPAGWGSTPTEIPYDCVRVEIPSKWTHVDVRVIGGGQRGYSVRALFIKFEVERAINLVHQRQRMLDEKGEEILNSAVVEPGTKVVVEVLPIEDDPDQCARFLPEPVERQERKVARSKRQRDSVRAAKKHQETPKEEVALDDFEGFELVDPM
jgi:hypothetical protein